MNENHRMELIEKLSLVGFYMYDLRLFLDTHPECCEAIEAFNRYACMKKELVAEYEKMYGPFTQDCRNFDEHDWRWTAYPWPWEGACN